MAEDFEAGAEIVRALAHADALPDVTRLSDPEETRISLAMSGMEGLKRSAFDAYLRLRGRTGGCMLITGWEGEPEDVERRRSISARILRSGRRGLARLGARQGVGARALRGAVPARRADEPRLLRRDARDVAHVVALPRALRRGPRARCAAPGGRRARPGIVMCHLSHAYRDGASLYYTFIAPSKPGARDRALARRQERRVRRDRRHRRHDHPPPRGGARPRSLHARPRWARWESKRLRALKERLDPAGIMNPGKLVA